MNLLLLPGSANPDVSDKHRLVYELIGEIAPQNGYKNVISDLRYPGHSTNATYKESPHLDLLTSVESTISRIRDLPNEPYTILARSYGCTVALKLLSQEAIVAHPPSKIILWGPLPYWRLWALYVADPHITENMQPRGVKILKSSFDRLEPIEHMIQSVSIPVRVATGELDTYCKPDFFCYLEKISNPNRQVSFAKIVANAAHEVTAACEEQVVRDYADALFR